MIELEPIEPLAQPVIIDAKLGKGEDLLLLALEPIEAFDAVVARGIALPGDTG
jgi:hypothetical protein